MRGTVLHSGRSDSRAKKPIPARILMVYTLKVCKTEYQERPMASKKTDRRGFLKSGVAVAGLAAGAVQSASGQAPSLGAPAKKSTKEMIAYGERSRFVTSIREPAEG